ncbi:hypothetical protein R50072_09110 [Simiduia litorea]
MSRASAYKSLWPIGDLLAMRFAMGTSLFEATNRNNVSILIQNRPNLGRHNTIGCHQKVRSLSYSDEHLGG